ncbi:MAG: hypothetical protein E7396_02330 [Ruminococcaceae bacterium]|nr:hypothetical protein [Oscillospiraceae bacterium]
MLKQIKEGVIISTKDKLDFSKSYWNEALGEDHTSEDYWNNIQGTTQLHTDYDEEIKRLEQSQKQYMERRQERLRLEKIRKKRRNITICVWIFVVLIVFFSVKLVMSQFMPEDQPTNVTEKTDTPTSDIKTDPPIEEEKPKADESLYSQFDFYISENLDRYIAYANANSDMAPDDIVWQVNMSLDKPKFSTDIPASGYDDPYIIVNKFYKVPRDFRPPDLESFDNQLLRKETGEAFIRMRNAASNEGLSIMAVSGYRSVEYQDNLYNSYLQSDSQQNVDRYSARPGYSEHHTGMAIDLFGSTHGLRNFINTPEYPWVKENAHKYGFIIRYTETGEFITGYEFEPWHIRYIGVEAATDMREKQIDTFEEYYARYIQNK